MNLDKLTTKAQEAIAKSQELAQELSHQALDGEHLALALAQQDDSLTPQLLQKLGVRLPAFLDDLQNELSRRPKVSGASQVYPSQDFQNALAAAQKEAKALKDDFVSTEHLLLGLLDKGGDALKNIFAKHLLKRDVVRCMPT